MKINNKYWVYRNEAGDGGDAGGSGGGAADPGGQQIDPAAGGGDGSALAGGSTDPEWSMESVPEKYRVKNDAGEIDIEATLRKVDEGRSNLEKRMGVGDVRPKEFGEYKEPELPAELAGVTLETETFKKEAHELGLTQKQYEAVMSRYYKELPGLVQGQVTATAAETTGSLKEAWGDQYSGNIRGAFTAATRLADQVGIPFEEVEKAIGNNAVALRILAAVGKEMREDTPPASAGGNSSNFDVNEAMASEAYTNPTHPKHAAVTKQVNDHFDKVTPKD